MPYAGPDISELWRHISQKFGYSNFGAIDSCQRLGQGYHKGCRPKANSSICGLCTNKWRYIVWGLKTGGRNNVDQHWTTLMLIFALNTRVDIDRHHKEPHLQRHVYIPSLIFSGLYIWLYVEYTCFMMNTSYIWLVHIQTTVFCPILKAVKLGEPI